MISLQEYIQPDGQEYMETIRSVSSGIHVCIPGIVLSFDKSTQTATVRPAITGKLHGQDAQLPMLLDVPVFFPGGADIAITFDVKKGDDCLVIFADSCIDGWFQRGDSQIPPINRHHDMSDGFALVGYRATPRKLNYQDNYSFAVRVKTSNGWKIPFAADSNGKAYIDEVEV